MPLLRPRVVEADAGDIEPISAGEQGPLGKIVKWIPIEVIGFYEAAMAALVDDTDATLRLWLTLIAWIICGFWIAFATKPKTKKYAWRQIILAMVAFVFWAAGIQSEVLSKLLGWKPVIFTLILLGGTMILPIINGMLIKLGVPQNK